MKGKLGLALVFAALLIPVSAYAATISVDYEGTKYDVDYTGTGATISSITPDPDFVSLIVDVDVTGSPGTLEIILQRNLIDAKFEGSDDPYIVIADGDEPNFEEVDTNSQSRTLRIELPLGTDEVEIIGTVLGSPVITPEPEAEPEAEPEDEPETGPEPEAEPEQKPPKPETTPKEETKPKVECGEGTILKDGVCVPDERCGPGTILKDGVCVALPEAPVTTGTGSAGRDLMVGAVAAFIIAFIVMIILYVISRGSRQKS